MCVCWNYTQASKPSREAFDKNTSRFCLINVTTIKGKLVTLMMIEFKIKGVILVTWQLTAGVTDSFVRVNLDENSSSFNIILQLEIFESIRVVLHKFVTNNSNIRLKIISMKFSKVLRVTGRVTLQLSIVSRTVCCVFRGELKSFTKQ